AIIVEVENYEPTAPNPFAERGDDEPETRPELTATWHFFADQEALDEGNADIVESGVLPGPGYKGLINGLANNVGKTLLLRMDSRPSKRGNAVRIWEPITDKKIVTKAEEYLSSLEEAPI